MRSFKFLIPLLFLVSISFAQNRILRTNQMFASTDLTDGKVVLTDADTVVSNLVPWVYPGNDADIRVSVGFDTTSGSGNKAFVDFGIQIGHFGDDAKDYSWTNLDSLEIADDGSSGTYQLYYSYSFLKAPILGWKIRCRQTGTQVNRLEPQVVYDMKR